MISRMIRSRSMFQELFYYTFKIVMQAKCGSKKTDAINLCKLLLFEVVTSSASNNISFGHLRPIIHSFDRNNATAAGH